MSDAPDNAERQESEQGEKADRMPGVIPGHRLLALIQRRLKERRQGEKTIPQILGVTGVYWTSLASGHRRLAGLPREKMKRLADWLGISVFGAYLLADAFELEDLFFTSNLGDDLDAVRAKMQADPSFAAFAPREDDWAVTPLASQLALAILYERVSGERLIRRSELQLEGSGRFMGILEI